MHTRKLSFLFLIAAVIFSCLVLLFLILSPGLLFFFKVVPVDKEVMRLSSPDGTIEAVYIQSDAGAMSSTDHLIYVLAKGENPAEGNRAVFEATKVSDLNVKWSAKRKLNIQYSKAAISHFQNYAYPLPEEAGLVEIREEPFDSESEAVDASY